jgi:hypothetical protein
MMYVVEYDSIIIIIIIIINAVEKIWQVDYDYVCCRIRYDRMMIRIMYTVE